MAKKSKKKQGQGPPSRRNIVLDFNNYFGSGTLEDWQRLCADIGLEGDFGSKNKCRNAIKTVHVNIYDLLDAVEADKHPEWFQNVRELSSYTRDTGRIYPKRHVKDKMGPVRALLRHIF